MTVPSRAGPQAVPTNAEALADVAAGLYVSGEEMHLVMAARSEGLNLSEEEMAVIEHMHAQGNEDDICLSALRSLIDRRRRRA